MRYVLLLLLVVMLSGCAEGGSFDVSIHRVDSAYLYEIDPPEPRNGYAYWEELQGHNGPRTECDIYLIPREDYFSLEEYHRVLGHEMDHCDRGEFHD